MAKHSSLRGCCGLVLISIGNSLRSDDGVGPAVCAALPESIKEQICWFDLGSYTNLLADCLEGHHTAIIVDATTGGVHPGAIKVLDLREFIEGGRLLSIDSCHGFSFFDEIRLSSKRIKLPDEIIFFGIETERSAWGNKLSPALESKLSQMVEQLCSLMHKKIRKLKRNA